MKDQGKRIIPTKETMKELEKTFRELEYILKESRKRGNNIVRICEEKGINYNAFLNVVRSADFRALRKDGYVPVDTIQVPRTPYEILMMDLLRINGDKYELHNIPYDNFESTKYVLRNMLPQLQGYIVSLRIGLITKPMEFKEIADFLVSMNVDARITAISAKYSYINSLIELRENGLAMRVLRDGYDRCTKVVEELKRIQENEFITTKEKETKLILAIVSKLRKIKISELNCTSVIRILSGLEINTYFDLIFANLSKISESKGFGPTSMRLVKSKLNEALAEFDVDMEYVRLRYSKDMFI